MSVIQSESQVELRPSNGASNASCCRRSSEKPAGYVNVSTTERLLSTWAGALLAKNGLRRRSLPGAVMAFVGGAMIYRGVTGHCQGYAALGIHGAPGKGAEPHEYSSRGIHVSQSVTIDRPAEELYAYWRDFENLPKFMGHLAKVVVLDGRRSHWSAKAPAGLNVTWDAEIINDVPNEKIAWRSLYPAMVDNAGSVRFIPAPEDRGTEVSVTLDYIPPAGRVGWIIAKLFGKDPASEVREDLRRFKAIMEAGEAPTITGQPHGKRSFIGSLVAE